MVDIIQLEYYIRFATITISGGGGGLVLNTLYMASLASPMEFIAACSFFFGFVSFSTLIRTIYLFTSDIEWADAVRQR